MKSLAILAAGLAVGLMSTSPVLGASLVQDRTRTQAAPAQLQGVQPRQARLTAEPQAPARATPVERRVYEDAATRMSRPGDDGPQYSCDHDSSGQAVSCWCNWDNDAGDCKDMILNAPCGESGAWWTSDIPGEYGCDRQN